jgi:hypothetical protein
MTKALRIAEAVILFYVGLGALVYGLLMVISPDGKLVAMPLAMLKGSPFGSYLFPGMILLSVNGLGSILAGILCVRRHAWAGWAGMVFGIGLIIWIFVQVSMIGGGEFIQYLYFGFGLAELLLGIAIRECQRLMPEKTFSVVPGAEMGSANM